MRVTASTWTSQFPAPIFTDFEVADVEEGVRKAEEGWTKAAEAHGDQPLGLTLWSEGPRVIPVEELRAGVRVPTEDHLPHKNLYRPEGIVNPLWQGEEGTTMSEALEQLED